MGRYSYSNRQEADGLKKLTVYDLKRYGTFKNQYSSHVINWKRGGEETGRIYVQSFMDDNPHYLKLSYTQTDNYTDEKQDFDYTVYLTTTPCYFGGVRYWFVCPLIVNGQYCGKRVGVLYKGGSYFGCRHCYDLTYSSRNQSGFFKACGKIISIPELAELEVKVKRQHYAGKPTRRYLSFLKKRFLSIRQLEIAAGMLNKKRTLSN